MHTRATSDYTPTVPGSKDENAAIVARKEMMKVFASREPKPEARRKTWRERMRFRTMHFDSPEAIKLHELKQSAKLKDWQAEAVADIAECFNEPAKKATKPRKAAAKKEPKVTTKVETKPRKSRAKVAAV